jgi:hypothetical protein
MHDACSEREKKREREKIFFEVFLAINFNCC